MKTLYLSVELGKKYGISKFPNFSAKGNITGMRKLYYGKDALLVKCGSYIYNVTRCPEIYDRAH